MIRQNLATIFVLFATCQALATSRAGAGPESSPTQGNYKSAFFDQQIDHSSSQGIFKQKYFVNSKYALGADAPVLFELCGESRCYKNENPSSPVIQYAQKFHAHVVVLEHRYYGDSIPTKDLSAENLKFLTIDNAIEDAANFERFVQSRLGFSGKWIVLGGSYSGILAATYRVRHPELVIGALASSAPVNIQEVLPGIDDNTSDLVGPACTRIIQSFTKQLEPRVQTADWPKVLKYFGMSQVKDARDFFYVLGDAASYFPRNPKYCEELKKKPSFQTFAKVVEDALKEQAGLTPYQDSYTALAHDSVDSGNGWRQWTYQTCREVGFFQVASKNPKKRLRSKLVDIRFFSDVCNRLFGMSSLPDYAEINRQIYLPILATSSNIVFTNGSADVWKALGISDENNNTTNPNNSYAFIENGLHCADLAVVKAPWESLLHARQVFIDNVTKWLAE